MNEELAGALERALGWTDEGVVHVAAVWRDLADLSGPRRVLRITPATPKSTHDALALSVCRARADAIVTTGRILREEADLRHDFTTDAEISQELADWRRDVLGRPEPPLSVLLTGRGDIDFRHPLFATPSRVLVLTGAEGAARARASAAEAGAERVEIAEREAPGIRDAVGALRDEWDARTISIEAGPSTAGALYDEPCAVDELVLSTFAEPELAPDLQGGDFPPASHIESLFGKPLEAQTANETSGRWHLARYRR